MKKVLLIMSCLFLPLFLYAQNKEGVKSGYVVAVQGRVALEDRILLSVSKMADVVKIENVTFIELEAVSETAKDTIKEIPINLPEPIYLSVEYVAKKVIAIKTAKTKKASNKALEEYIKSIKEANDLVCIYGFRIIEDSFNLSINKK